jgi:hypothetical protein
MNVAHPAVEFLAAMFKPHTDGRIYLISLPNNKTDAAPKPFVLTRNAEQITDFTTRHDQPGKGCFVCVGLVKDGATRRAEKTISLIVCAHADIDFTQVEEAPEEIERALAAPALAAKPHPSFRSRPASLLVPANSY